MTLKETRKKLKAKGLYVVVTQISSNRWLKLMHEKTNKPLLSLTSKPVVRVKEFFKLFDDCLSHLDWDVYENELTDEYLEAFLKVKGKIITNFHDKWEVYK